MKRHFLYPLLYTIAGGFIVLLLNSWLLAPSDRSESILAYHNAIEIPPDTWSTFLSSKIDISKLPESAKKLVSLIMDNEFGSNVIVDTYEIRNSSDEATANISIIPSGVTTTLLSDGNGVKSIADNQVYKYGKLLPDQSVKIFSVYYGYETLSSYENHQDIAVLVGDKKIPVAELRLTPDSTEAFIFFMLNNYPFWTFVFFMLAVVAWIVIVISVIVSITTYNNIPLRAKNLSEGDAARMINVLGYIEKHDPGRMTAIRNRAQAELAKAA